VLYQAWAFVAPGLYEHEKKLALPLVIGSTVLFLTGVAVLLLLRLRQGVQLHPQFRAQVDQPGAGHRGLFQLRDHDVPRFGVTFEIPIVVIVLVRMGLVSLEKLRDARPTSSWGLSSSPRW